MKISKNIYSKNKNSQNRASYINLSERSERSLFRRSAAASILNKKAVAGPQTMIWAFALIVIVMCLGIVLAVSIFFAADYDFRQADADILNYKLNDCLAKNEIDFTLSPEQFAEKLYVLCDLNKQVIEENFFMHIKSEQNEYVLGKGDQTQCALSEKNTNYPKCRYSSLKSGIEIQTGSNQKSLKLQT
jgi:hypothetical protein